ncbi:MAG: hypothetical protein COB51_08625 [Moraxellaceae bacterium]|nr:MAG: hypothetical protein COB51_08625 [Moraxellaceae bacterium]
MTITVNSISVSNAVGYSGVKASTDSASVSPADTDASKTEPAAKKDDSASIVTLSRSQLESYRNTTKSAQKASKFNVESSSPTSVSKATSNVSSHQKLELDASQAKQELTLKQARLRQAESSSRNVSQDLAASKSSESNEAELRQLKNQIRQAQKLERNLQQEIKQQENKVAQFERRTQSVAASSSALVSEGPAPQEGVNERALDVSTAAPKSTSLPSTVSSDASPVPSQSTITTSVAKSALNFNANKVSDLKIKQDSVEEENSAAVDDDETAADRFKKANKINEDLYTDYFSRTASTEFIESIDTYFNPQKV